VSGAGPTVVTLPHWFEAQACRALAHPARLDILRLLAQSPQTVTHLADKLGQPVHYISRHLRVLRETLLVKTHPLGSTVTYSLSDPRIGQVMELLGIAASSWARWADLDTAVEGRENVLDANQ